MIKLRCNTINNEHAKYDFEKRTAFSQNKCKCFSAILNDLNLSYCS